MSDDDEIEARFRAKLQRAARMVARELGEDTGFVVFAFDKEAGDRLSYISNSDRQDCIRRLGTWIKVQNKNRTTAPRQNTRVKRDMSRGE